MNGSRDKPEKEWTVLFKADGQGTTAFESSIECRGEIFYNKDTQRYEINVSEDSFLTIEDFEEIAKTARLLQSSGMGLVGLLLTKKEVK